MISSLKLSLTIGVLSSVIATIIGTLAAYALYKVNAKRRQLFQTVFDLPIVTPDLVLGIGLLIFYRTIHFETGLASVILAHITFNIPFAILIVSTRFKFIDDNLENAAIDLGASQTKAFFNVTVPMIKPGIFAAMLICFTLSWDDFIIAFFTSGVGVNTLPVKVYSMMKVGLNPQINAICVLLIAVSILVLLISLIFEKPTDYLKT
jgi:spermidine/putrescine transport system permease protein